MLIIFLTYAFHRRGVVKLLDKIVTPMEEEHKCRLGNQTAHMHIHVFISMYVGYICLNVLLYSRHVTTIWEYVITLVNDHMILTTANY